MRIFPYDEFHRNVTRQFKISKIRNLLREDYAGNLFVICSVSFVFSFCVLNGVKNAKLSSLKRKKEGEKSI